MKREIPLFIVDSSRKHKKGECDYICCTDKDSGFIAKIDYIDVELEAMKRYPKNISELLKDDLTSKEIEDLQDRDKEIMTLRYGLNNTKEYTQKEVAEILGISQSYISRIEKKVIRKLKQVMIR